MNIQFEELTLENIDAVREINRDDISEAFVDNVDTVAENLEYGIEHGCIGHFFAIKSDDRYIGMILIGEALVWETDPPEMREEPFYRIMGFVIDKDYRNSGIGGQVLEEAIQTTYDDFGVRSLTLGCHKDNKEAARFYEKHHFVKTEYMEGNDVYYLRLVEK